LKVYKKYDKKVRFSQVLENKIFIHELYTYFTQSGHPGSGCKTVVVLSPLNSTPVKHVSNIEI
jgi:hypothetical protein